MAMKAARTGVAVAFGAALLCVAGSPTPLPAQEMAGGTAVLGGIVEDRSLRTGIAAASLHLVREARDSTFAGPAFQAVARSNGSFSFPGIPTGRYQLTVEALGYEVLVDEILVTGDSHLLVALVPRAIELEPLVVLSRRSRYLEGVGFYQRRDLARTGSTFTREEVASAGGYLVSDVLRNVPGVTLRRTRTETPVVLFRGGCRPDVVVDGINLGVNVLIDDVVRPGDVEGLEVHRGGTVLFPFSNSICGSVVAWTVDPSARDDGLPFSWRRFFTGVVMGGMIIARASRGSR
jgi:hypothetical protein